MRNDKFFGADVEIITICDDPESAEDYAAGFEKAIGWNHDHCDEAMTGRNAIEAAARNLDEPARTNFFSAIRRRVNQAGPPSRKRYNRRSA